MMDGNPSNPCGFHVGKGAIIASGAELSDGCWIGPAVQIASGVTVAPGAVVGFPGPDKAAGVIQIGQGSWIGPQVTIEPGVVIGADCVIGAGTVIRAGARVGQGVRIGARCTIMGQCVMEDFVCLEADVHVSEFATLCHHSQLMPGCVLLNDAYPPTAMDPMGPTVGACAIVGVNAVIYPRVKLGFHSMVSASSVVKKDVDDFTLVNGSPAQPVCDVRRIRCQIDGKWLYPYPWMRCLIPGEDLSKPST